MSVATLKENFSVSAEVTQTYAFRYKAALKSPGAKAGAASRDPPLSLWVVVVLLGRGAVNVFTPTAVASLSRWDSVSPASPRPAETCWLFGRELSSKQRLIREPAPPLPRAPPCSAARAGRVAARTSAKPSPEINSHPSSYKWCRSDKLPWRRQIKCICIYIHICKY